MSTEALTISAAQIMELRIAELRMLMGAATTETLVYMGDTPNGSFGGEVRTCEKFRHICTEDDDNAATMAAMVGAFNMARDLLAMIDPAAPKAEGRAS